MSKELSKLYCACRSGDADTVKKILPTLTLEEIDHVEPNGSTALHAASHFGHTKIVKLLLDRCPNTSIFNQYEKTAEDEAANSEIKALFASIPRGDEFSTQGSSVCIFKNGYCLIVKKLEIPPNKDNAPLEIVDLPENAVYGTFSIQTTSNVSVSSIQTKKIYQEVHKKCSNTEELIKANLDRENIELLVQGLESNPVWLKGKMQVNSLDQDDKDSKDLTITAETMIIVEKTDGKTIAIPRKSIISIQGENLKTIFTQRLLKYSLQMYYKNHSDSNGWAFMKYVTYGITWVPSYDLTLLTNKRSKTKTLRLSLKCVIINDTEDVQAANLACIVGHPNLSKYIKVTDPLFTGMSTEEYFKEIAKCEYPSSSSTNKYSSNRQYDSPNFSGSAAASSDDNDKEEEDDANNDFHLYQFHNILLEKKEKLLLSVFDIEVPYKDLYRCKIDRTQQHNNYSSITTSDEFTMPAEVWHAIEFENKSKHILSTAPVTITQDNHQLICQESLPFTLKNNSTLVHLTKAPTIQVKYEEKAADTQSSTPATVTILKKKYVKEEWNGSLIVTNTKNELVTLIIELRLYGEMSKYSVAPKIDAVQHGKNVVNKLHNIRWDISLDPQQKVEINYRRLFLQ